MSDEEEMTRGGGEFDEEEVLTLTILSDLEEGRLSLSSLSFV